MVSWRVFRAAGERHRPGRTILPGSVMRPLRILAAAALEIFVALLLLEAGLRLFGLAAPDIRTPGANTSLYRPGATLVRITEGYARKRINSHGLLDREYSLDDGTVPVTRILLFGDSYTAANHVLADQVFDNVAEDLLSSAERRVEIWNLGRPGAGTLDQLALYGEISDRFPHSVVLVQFTNGDLDDNWTSESRLEGNTLISGRSQRKPVGSITRIRQEITSRSAVANTAVRRLAMLRSYLEKKALPWRIRLGVADPPAQSPDAANRLTEGLAHQERILAHFRNEASRRGARLMLFHIPGLSDELEGDGSERTPEHHHEIRAISEQQGVTYLDVFDPVLAADRRARGGDRHLNGFLNTTLGVGHLSVHGHQVVGRILAEELRKEIAYP